MLNRKETNSANPRFLRVTTRNAGKGDLQIINEGFRGMGIKKGLRYDFSVMYRQQAPGVKLHVELLNAVGHSIGDTVLTPSASDKEWHKQAVSFYSSDTALKAKLNLWFEGNGDVNSKWGKVRAGMGHPATFNLKMMGVGNENWGPQYLERLKIFTKAIKEKYPDFKIINSSGTDPDGDRFEYLNTELRNMKADIIDEHYYRRPEWFLQNAKRYDSYPRNAAKIFAGEYAAQSDKVVSVNNKIISAPLYQKPHLSPGSSAMPMWW